VRDKQVRRGWLSLTEEALKARQTLALDEARRDIRKLVEQVEQADRQTVLEILGEIERAVRDIRKNIERRQEKPAR